jgi:hypothetical protein
VLVALLGDGGGAAGDLEFRAVTLRVGCLLGWVSVAVVVVGVVSGGGSRQRGLLVALTGAAAVANAVWMRVPWREWLSRRRGRFLLGVWSGGLLGYVGALVVFGGGSFALLFLWRRRLWLLCSGGAGVWCGCWRRRERVWSCRLLGVCRLRWVRCVLGL